MKICKNCVFWEKYGEYCYYKDLYTFTKATDTCADWQEHPATRTQIDCTGTLAKKRKTTQGGKKMTKKTEKRCGNCKWQYEYNKNKNRKDYPCNTCNMNKWEEVK